MIYLPQSYPFLHFNFLIKGSNHKPKAISLLAQLTNVSVVLAIWYFRNSGVLGRINILMVLAVLPKKPAFWVSWSGNFSMDAIIQHLVYIGHILFQIYIYNINYLNVNVDFSFCLVLIVGLNYVLNLKKQNKFLSQHKLSPVNLTWLSQVYGKMFSFPIS